MAIDRHRCYVCDKGVAHGNSRSHANNSTRRTWKPNLQVARVVADGKIVKITETDVSLREIVQDAAGEWIERPSALQLQEQAR